MNSQVYDQFIADNPQYREIQDNIVNLLSKYEDKKRLEDLLPNECFIFGIMGVIDRLLYDEGIIDEKFYDKIQDLLKQLAKFNFFTYYHSKLFNISDKTSDSEILESKLYL